MESLALFAMQVAYVAAFGLAKSKLPQLCPVIEPVEIFLKIIIVFRISGDPKNCTYVRKSRGHEWIPVGLLMSPSSTQRTDPQLKLFAVDHAAIQPRGLPLIPM